ncbi:MAG TPA: hypothetical protein VMV57_15770, partial [Terracidiphilus sp.]|nr:hypothetical protein [Terracidiphilus sp.]
STIVENKTREFSKQQKTQELLVFLDLQTQVSYHASEPPSGGLSVKGVRRLQQPPAIRNAFESPRME